MPKEVKPHHDRGSAATLNLTVIAQCATTLELIPVAADAVSILKEALPLYSSSYGVVGLGFAGEGPAKATGRGTKQTLFENVPLSQREFQAAWLDLCAFETSGHAWIPSALDCSGIWKSIMSAAILENADLVRGFYPDALRDIVIQQDAYPEGLFNAVLRKLCKDSSNVIDCSM